MKRLAVALTVSVWSLSLFAADMTYELLTAPWVQDRLRFQVTQDRKLQALRDGGRTYVDVADGAPFVLSEQRDLVFRDFNPFKVAIVTSETTEKDPNYTAIAQFLDALKGTTDAIQPPLAAGGAPPASQTQQLRQINADLYKRAVTSLALGSTCPEYDKLQEVLTKIHDAFNNPIVKTSQFKSWVDRGTTAADVKTVHSEIDTAVTNLQDDVAVLIGLDKSIRERFATVTETCDRVQTSTFALVYEATRSMDSHLNAERQLASDLQTLSSSLKKYEDPTAWREDSKSDYIFYKPTPDFETIKILNIAVKPRSFSFGDDGKVSVTEGTGVSRTIRLRAFSRIVPEVAGGFVHTDLAYPKYGTKEVGGQTVVASAGTEKLPVGGAILLNLVCRCWAPSVVYPAVQVGLTNARQYPGFLVGGGLRFAGKYSFSLIGGWVITWFDDLDGLAVNQPVAGTAELQSHLKRRRAPAKTYVGVQYNF